MNQAQNLKIPTPLHAQLKALAAARSTTMVEVIATTVRQAIEAGEIKPETSGLSVGIFLDLDVDEQDGPGSWAVIKTNDGAMPYMSRSEAEFIADALLSYSPIGPVCFCTNRFGYWSIQVRGTSIKLIAGNQLHEEAFTTVIMAPVVARALGMQLRELAPKLTATALPTAA